MTQLEISNMLKSMGFFRVVSHKPGYWVFAKIGGYEFVYVDSTGSCRRGTSFRSSVRVRFQNKKESLV